MVAILALLALAQAPMADGPVRTAPVVPAARPAPRPAPVLPSRATAQPPEDDYGFVAWCFGALETYLGLYDRVMPEVTRIERAFPGPRGADADLKVYPQMRDQARKDLATFRTAIVAAEKASPRPIAQYGAASMRRGRAVWTGAANMKNAEVAREWMGWAPPAKCEDTAKSLTIKSSVLGQALILNAQPVPETPSAVPPEPTPVAAPPAPAPAAAPAPIPAVAVTPPPAPRPAQPVAAPRPAPAPPVVTPAAAQPPAPRPVTPQPATPRPTPAPAPPAPTPPPPAPRPVTVAAPAPKTAPAPPRTVVAQTSPAPAPAGRPPAVPVVAAPTGPQPVLPKGAYVMDPDGDKGCPGRLDASIRAGRIVMVCLP